MSITNDIAVGLKAPFATAEEIKLTQGHAVPEDVGVNETIDLVVFGETGRQVVPRQFLAEIIGARTEEILGLVLREVKRSGYDALLPAGLVICGGTALLPGLPKLARRLLNMPVRTAAPRDIQGLVDELASPAYATAVGLLRWGIARTAQAPVKQRESTRGKFWDIFKALLPG
jgi:cell division protein FtsA